MNMNKQITTKRVEKIRKRNLINQTCKLKFRVNLAIRMKRKPKQNQEGMETLISSTN